MARGVQLDDIDKMEATIAEYKKYLADKEFVKKLEERTPEYIKDIKEHQEPPKPEDWWKSQLPEPAPPPPDEEDSEYEVPWYIDKDGYHER